MQIETTTRRPNPFDVSAPYAATMRMALAMTVVPGLGTGLLLVLVAGLRLHWAIPWPQLAQAHGQVQTLGFVVPFIIAVALQLFPRFLSAPLLHADRAVIGAAVLALALLVRFAAQPLDDGPPRSVLLVVSALAVPVGAMVAGTAFHGLSARSVQPVSGPSAAWRQFVGVGGTALGAALVLSVWAGLLLAQGYLVVPEGVDEALIHLELFGFPTALVLAVGSRIFGRFLILRTRPALELAVPRLALLWGVGLALVAAGWLWSAGVWLRVAGSVLELALLLVWLWLVGLYAPPARSSGTPYVTVPTRRWVRLAFGFLVLSLVLSCFLFAREAVLGAPPLETQLSAARHALAQGFLLPMMSAMAARLLPIFSADVLRHRMRLEVAMDLLFVGALVRVGAELIQGYEGWAGPAVALGGGLGVLGFLIVAVGLWSSLGRLPGMGAQRRSSPARVGRSE